MKWYQLVVLCAVIVLTAVGTLWYRNTAAEAARQACERQNTQHDLQTAMSGGQYAWPHEACR